MRNKKVIHIGGCNIECDNCFVQMETDTGRFSGGIWLRNSIKRFKLGWEFCSDRVELSLGPIDMWMWYQR